jgi:hypothetical protein
MEVAVRAAKLGYDAPMGKPRSRSVRYVWILGEGAEFDIPAGGEPDTMNTATDRSTIRRVIRP